MSKSAPFAWIRARASNILTLTILTLGIGVLGVALLGARNALGDNDFHGLEQRAEAGEAVAQRQVGEALLAGTRGATRDRSKGMNFLEKAAAQDDAHAHYLIAWYYQYGGFEASGVDPRDKIITHYKRAAVLGHTTAQVQYARLMFEYIQTNKLAGNTYEVYRSEAVRLVENAATARNGLGQFDFAELKWEGKFVQKDEAGAIALYRLAAENHQPLASYKLSSIYLDTKRKDADENQGVKYLRLAADGDVPAACLGIAERFERGKGIGRDLELAQHYAQRAADLGLHTADGSLLRIAAAADAARHETELATLKAQADEAKEQNQSLQLSVNDTAAKLAEAEQRAAQTRTTLDRRQADYDGQADQLTKLTLDLAAANKDKQELKSKLDALQAAQAASDQRVKDAESRNLALQKELDESRAKLALLETSRSEAIARAERAESQIKSLEQTVPDLRAGRAPAAVAAQAAPSAKSESAPKTTLAPTVADAPVAVAAPIAGTNDELVTRGLAAVREERFVEAVGCFQLAANQGDARAMNNLGLMLVRGTGIEKDAKRAAKLFEEAVAKGNAAAANNLGHLYHHGIGVPADAAMAERWYTKAVDMGNRSAIEQLNALKGARAVAAR